MSAGEIGKAMALVNDAYSRARATDRLWIQKTPANVAGWLIAKLASQSKSVR